MKRNIDKSEQVFEYIKSYITQYGYAPTVRDICKSCDLKSTATAFTYINELVKRGVLNKVNCKNRAVSLKQGSIKTVPLVGTVAAGQPIFATENYEDFYSIPGNFFAGEDLFMLTVSGDSMINIGMFDGDKIVVKKQENADNGDIVVALVEESATVKRFFKRDGKIILHPENDTMQDFVFENVTIIGKVVGLLRSI
jgi:repressor LexA